MSKRSRVLTLVLAGVLACASARVLIEGVATATAAADELEKGTPLRIILGQTPIAFAELNSDSEIFSAAMGMAIFHSVSELDIRGPGLSGPLKFVAALGHSGSAVLEFQAPAGEEVTRGNLALHRASFRPLSSQNTVDETIQIAHHFYDVMSARKDCSRIKTDGNKSGLTLFKKYGRDWPKEELQKIHTVPNYVFLVEDTYRCGGFNVVFEVMDTHFDGKVRTYGFDVSIYAKRN